MVARTRWLAVMIAPFVGACSDVEGDGHDDHGHTHEHEVITTVELVFTDGAGTQTFVWADPEDDGSPVIDTVDLAAGTYTVELSFLNELEDPAEDITPEIADETDEHQVFFTGSAVNGPAADNPGAPLDHVYDDVDAGGLPVGLENTLVATAGSGDLVVTLRHLPEESGSPTKVDGLASDVAAGGLSAIGGESDVSVTFPVTVQ